MKHIILIAALLTLPQQLLADNEICTMAGEVAAQIMLDRQAEKPITEVIKARTFEGSPINKMVRAMIIEAYEQPAMRSSGEAARQVAEFRNSAQLQCLKIFWK